MSTYWGVRGHATRENLWFLGSLKGHFLHFEDAIFVSKYENGGGHKIIESNFCQVFDSGTSSTRWCLAWRSSSSWMLFIFTPSGTLNWPRPPCCRLTLDGLLQLFTSQPLYQPSGPSRVALHSSVKKTAIQVICLPNSTRTASPALRHWDRLYYE